MKFLKILVLLFIFVALVTGGVSFWIYKSVNAPHSHSKSNQFIQIPKGATPNEIISKLSTEGILANELPTQVYLRAFGDASKLRAGEYQFESPITPLQVLKELEKGEERTMKIT